MIRPRTQTASEDLASDDCYQSLGQKSGYVMCLKEPESDRRSEFRDNFAEEEKIVEDKI